MSDDGTVTAYCSPGTPETDVWCDVCLQNSAVTWPISAVFPDGTSYADPGVMHIGYTTFCFSTGEAVCHDSDDD